MLNALSFSHQLLSEQITHFPQGTFIDATLGNGHDSYKILQNPHFDGQLIGFDIQAQAIQSATDKLSSHHHYSRVQLIHDSHSHITKYLAHQAIHAAIFNLGYLPGGDHNITTVASETLTAITTICEQLVVRGKILIVVYSGHPQGMEEKQQLLTTLATLPQKYYQVLKYEFINQQNQPPLLLVIEKIKAC